MCWGWIFQLLLWFGWSLWQGGWEECKGWRKGTRDDRRSAMDKGTIGGTVLVNANMKCISSCQEALSLSLFPLFYSISSISLPPLYIDSPFSANSPTIINVRKPALSLFPLSQCISANGLLSSLLFPLSHFAVSIHWYDSLSTLTLVTPHEAWEVWGYKA